VVGSDLISGGETVKNFSKISDGLARRDKNFSTPVKIQFKVQRTLVPFMGNSLGGRL
jgi:hypothetical protein